MKQKKKMTINTATINMVNMINNMEKFVRASPMNTPEENKCFGCEKVIFEKELFMQCQTKGHNGEAFLRNYCCDCFKMKIEEDIERIEKWHKKTIWDLANMLSPIMEYMNSETKKQLDANRKMLEKIEDENGL